MIKLISSITLAVLLTIGSASATSFYSDMNTELVAKEKKEKKEKKKKCCKKKESCCKKGGAEEKSAEDEK